MAAPSPTVAGKILHNSFWYGLETVLETIVFLGTSIAVARYLGPEKLGYFSYVNFFVMVVNRTSGTGLASATRKYMSEFLALEQPGVARAVYYLAYRYQLIASIVITLIGLAGFAVFGDPSYRVMSFILILSIVPGVMSWVPAQANQAFEDVSKNTLSALGYLLSYTVVVILTLTFHWDLIGIASASFLGRLVEVFLRTVPLHARLRALPREAMPPVVAARIRRYCVQALGIQILMSVVWDRSEIVFLRAFSSLEQLAFYSVSFGLANNLLLIPRTFGGATGITLMVESARDPERVRSIVKTACRYLLLVVFPVHLGAAAITSQAIRFTYGVRYAGAVPVLIIASILAIPRAFQEIPEVLMRAADRQKQLLHWLIVTGVLNILLDALLIPRYGAVGAAWGNGLSQTFGVVAIWRQARHSYQFSLPLWTAAKFLAAGGAMAACAYVVGRAIPGLPGLIIAIVTAAPIYIILVKVLHALEPSDRLRLMPISNRFPHVLQRVYLQAITFVTPGVP